MNTSLRDLTKSLNDISATLIQIQLNLSQLNSRVDTLEDKDRGLFQNMPLSTIKEKKIYGEKES